MFCIWHAEGLAMWVLWLYITTLPWFFPNIFQLKYLQSLAREPPHVGLLVRLGREPRVIRSLVDARAEILACHHRLSSPDQVELIQGLFRAFMFLYSLDYLLLLDANLLYIQGNTGMTVVVCLGCGTSCLVYSSHCLWLVSCLSWQRETLRRGLIDLRIDFSVCVWVEATSAKNMSFHLVAVASLDVSVLVVRGNVIVVDYLFKRKSFNRPKLNLDLEASAVIYL